MRVRMAVAADLELLPAIEVAAGSLFRDLGMHEIADDAPPTVDELAQAAAVLVATTGPDELVVGYARIEVVDGHAHLEQLSVHPDHGRRGIGTALLDAVTTWAAERGDDVVTLTTFTNVSFNAPYYRRQGWVDVPPNERGPELVALIDQEAAHGLDPATRVVLARRTGLQQS